VESGGMILANRPEIRSHVRKSAVLPASWQNTAKSREPLKIFRPVRVQRDSEVS
jgi:hypothetical protein